MGTETGTHSPSDKEDLINFFESYTAWDRV